ncbi:unnamed protein product [Ceutorhynchus assimilis]|uniref:Uncharacterized protein n=1 Tax=Ceutorhynchus assimilis TaxID=467358 RepID=A0A9N9MC84_9CUCU|nr:unnamed protein product [Ceutorhynchus assimilis]
MDFIPEDVFFFAVETMFNYSLEVVKVALNSSTELLRKNYNPPRTTSIDSEKKVKLVDLPRYENVPPKIRKMMKDRSILMSQYKKTGYPETNRQANRLTTKIRKALRNFLKKQMEAERNDEQ